MTPLHKAAWEGHTKIVELLLEEGADRSATDNVRRRYFMHNNYLFTWTVRFSTCQKETYDD